MYTNESKLTADFCRRNYVVFRPQTIDEAVFIQERLADFGIRWCDGLPVGARAQDCVNNGMVVQQGQLYHSPGHDAQNVLCTSDQFDTDYMPPDRRFMIEMFNKLAGRIDTLVTRIEALEKKVEAVHEAAFPGLDSTKPGLKKPQRPEM